MNAFRPFAILFLSGAALLLAGCEDPRGKPHPGPEVVRPDHVLDFATLYHQNCVACHGDSSQAGAAIPLTNPVYLAVAGEGTIRGVIANGVPGKLMPPFGKAAGGMLTDEQVEILAKGIVSTWGKPGVLDGQNPPPYKATVHEDAAVGQRAYDTYCARCHGSDGQGNAAAGKPASEPVTGSIVDPAYLGLISDQNLRSIVIAGLPGMPDWRGEGHGPSPGRAMTDEEVTSVVGWLASHRQSAQSPAEPAAGDVSGPPTKKAAPASGTKREEPH